MIKFSGKTHPKFIQTATGEPAYKYVGEGTWRLIDWDYIKFHEKLHEELEKKRRKFDGIERHVQHVLKLREGETMAIPVWDMDYYFDNNHNPLKGETRSTEMNKWFKFLVTVHNIKVHEDYQHAAYLFKKFKRESFDEQANNYRNYVGKSTSEQDRIDRINNFRCNNF